MNNKVTWKQNNPYNTDYINIGTIVFEITEAITISLRLMDESNDAIQNML